MTLIINKELLNIVKLYYIIDGYSDSWNITKFEKYIYYAFLNYDDKLDNKIKKQFHFSDILAIIYTSSDNKSLSLFY